MSDPILPLEVWEEGTLQNDVPANDNALRNEAMSRNVLGIANSPASSDDGDVYIVGPAPTGDFATFSPDDLTIYRGGTWYAWAPVEGVFVNVAGTLGQYTGSGGWVSFAGGGGGVQSVVAGTNISVDNTDPANPVVSASGGGTPAGANTNIQYNASGAFGAEAAFSYDPATNTLTVDNITMNGLLLTLASATGGAGLRVPHGTAPTTPTNGDVWTTTAGMYARINGVTVGPFSAGGGSLTNWTEGVNTSTPNATVPVVYFQVSNAATDVDAVPGIAKGSGATIAQVPDNTTTGGNKRGIHATDWQKLRSANTQVASGSRSTVGGGQRNTASSDETTVGGGYQNTASTASATVAGGRLNTASGTAAFVGGGDTNAATANYASVVGGNANDADGVYSTAMGYKAQCRGIQGAVARSVGGFNNFDGDGQSRAFYLCQATTNATQATATTDRAAAGTANQIVLPNSSAFVIKGTINVRENATGDSSAWEFTAYIKRGANAAATAMVAACTPTLIAQDAGAATWVVTVDADTTNGALRCRVTGEASHNLKWGWDIYSCNEVVS